MTISVFILTLNEEINIKACIESLQWSDDIVVLDSFSDDSTVAIAESLGARVVKRKFDNWSTHQNWAMSNIEFNNPWVLYFDADERCPVELRQEIVKAIDAAGPYNAFRIRRKDFFMGRWLKRAQLYPTWIVRLFRPEKITYERLVNPIAIVDGEIGELEEHIHHFPFSHGVSHWIERHNKYSGMEALELIKGNKLEKITFSNLYSGDPNTRRAELKNIFFRMPARPLIKFIYYYIIRLGLLDGRPGFVYSILQSFYEFMISIKAREITMRNEGHEL